MEEGRNGQWTIMKATRDGRFKVIAEDFEQLAGMHWRQGTYFGAKKPGILVDGIPLQAKLVEIKYPVNYGEFKHIVFLFEHESFDIVKKGETIPSLQPFIRYPKENQSLEEFLVEQKAERYLPK